jgi:hypothetical protein
MLSAMKKLRGWLVFWGVFALAVILVLLRGAWRWHEDGFSAPELLWFAFIGGMFFVGIYIFAAKMLRGDDPPKEP